MALPDDIPLFWSAGHGRGWPVPEVIATLERAFGFPERPGYVWAWGTPFMVNRGGLHPFIITSDPQKADIALLAGEDVAWLPGLMGPPHEPPAGYVERYGSTGDPWLIGVT